MRELSFDLVSGGVSSIALWIVGQRQRPEGADRDQDHGEWRMKGTPRSKRVTTAMRRTRTMAPPTAQTLLREAVDAGLPPPRTRKRPPPRFPGHTPKAGIHRSLAKIDMLDSPGTDLSSSLLETEPVIEKKQCVTLAVAAGIVWSEKGQKPDAQEVQRRAQDYRLEQTRPAVEAAQALGDPDEVVTAVEHEMRVYVHDLTTAHHEKDFRSLAVFPINDLQDVKMVVLRTDYRGGVIVESVVGPHWKPGGLSIKDT